MALSRVLVVAVMILLLGIAASAVQAQSPPGPDAAKPPKITKEQMKEMRAKWRANQPKLKACRAEARKKGLAGDDRWFFMEDCMDKP